jgi:hypothetical protein
MSKSKTVGIMALIVFAIGILLVGDALAGEKHRLIGVYHTIKFEQMNVPGEEGRVIALWEGKAVTRNKDGKRFGEGLIIHGVGYAELNMKTGIGSGHFYEECTDQDGDKFYTDSEGRGQKIGGVASWEGRLTITKGTGKYQGIQGGVTWKNWSAGPDQLYFDWNVEVELPR